ncbi:Uncharacterised protein [Nocardia farcinica]|uniref:Uncharacterized protein n=1 Tax=Nocardia farcinica TaxID=37329 RepID=A0A449G752_NOCFR|nr:hypothetical protein [Nocardia farcinica]VFA94760.1 Uncharacterised protein [Nocardia farcinica]
MSDTVERALAEMRAGRRVLVLTMTEPGARAMHDRAAALLTDGERARRSGLSVTSAADRGRLMFATIRTAPARFRGNELDSVYVDHDELRRAAAPAMMTSAVPSFICS